MATFPPLVTNFSTRLPPLILNQSTIGRIRIRLIPFYYPFQYPYLDSTFYRY